jgi:hypothetical protein
MRHDQVGTPNKAAVLSRWFHAVAVLRFPKVRGGYAVVIKEQPRLGAGQQRQKAEERV